MSTELTDTQRDDLRRYAESINGSESSYGATILKLMTECEELHSSLQQTPAEHRTTPISPGDYAQTVEFHSAWAKRWRRIVDERTAERDAALSIAGQRLELLRIASDAADALAAENSELRCRTPHLSTVAALREEKNAAYSERDMIICAFAKFAVALGWEAWVGRHEGDEPWDVDWLSVVYVVTPHGQVSWHVHDSELNWFNFLPRRETPGWDGHTSVEKYARLGSISLRSQEPDVTKCSLEDEICLSAATEKMRAYMDLQCNISTQLRATHDAAVVFADAQMRVAGGDFAAPEFDALCATLQCSAIHTVGGTTSNCMLRRDHDGQHAGGNLDGEEVLWDDEDASTHRKAREIMPDAIIQERLHQEYDRQMNNSSAED